MEVFATAYCERKGCIKQENMWLSGSWKYWALDLTARILSDLIEDGGLQFCQGWF